MCCFLSFYCCLKFSWLEVFQMPHETTAMLNVWLSVVPLRTIELWDSRGFKKFTPKGDVKRRVQLNSFVDTTLDVLGEQHFLLDSKHTDRNQGLVRPQTELCWCWSKGWGGAVHEEPQPMGKSHVAEFGRDPTLEKSVRNSTP